MAYEGRRIFASNCASCHGLDGRGSERAPDIVEKREVQRLSDTELAGIVQEGVPGTGMPAFRSLRAFEIKAVVAYLRALEGGDRTGRTPGDPERGRILFGKAGCSQCHMLSGSGGFIASDLSSYGAIHSVAEIRVAIRHRQATAATATVSTADGHKYTGRIRNEDNFSLQVQALDGTFYFFPRSKVEQIEYGGLVPADYNSRLSEKELDDVISFLIKSAGGGRSQKASEPDE